MIADTSAIMAILLREPEDVVFAEALRTAPQRLVSAVSVLEAGIVSLHRRGANGVAELNAFLATAGLEVAAFDERQTAISIDAYARFGKGRHPAGLNFGDCCVYALAISEGLPLLYKGGDFAKTDVMSALP